MKKIFLQNKKYILLSIPLVVITIIISLITPFFLNKQKDVPSASIYYVIGFVLFSMLLSYFIQILLIIYRENYSKKFNIKQFFSLLESVYSLKFEQFIHIESGTLVSRIFNIVDTNYIFITSSVLLILKSILSISIILLVLFKLNSMVFYIILFLIPLNFFSYRMINKTLKIKIALMQKENSRANKELISLLSNPEQFKLMKDFYFVKSIVSSGVNSMYSSLSSINKFAQITSNFIYLVNQLAQNIIFILISYLVSTNKLNLNDMMIVSILLPIFFVSLADMSKINIDYRTLAANEEFIEENLLKHQDKVKGIFLDSIRTIKLIHPKVTIKATKNPIQFTFDVKEVINLGDICYIEGPSGSGKSTLIKSMLGLYESTGIFINDYETNKIDLSTIRKNISYLSQTTLLFSETLEYNISMGEELTNKEELQNSKLLKPLFSNKEWDTKIIDNGSNLSGGEKQRIFIARMLLENKPIWILDESTSSIDTKSSDDIFETILKYSKDRIIIFTSHDKNNIKFANKLIRLG